ncbi:MAG: hypothetical protein JWQ32_1737 [Marmoricola sp.]|nr:hypothetical protein [Marmoricola sp.]
MRRFGAALAISMLLVTSGCGGSSSSRPSADDISKALRKGDSVLGAASSKLSKKSADCVGKVFVASKLSDKALQAIVAANKAYKPSTTDTAAINGLETKIVACITNP